MERTPRHRYRTVDEDSGRWASFEFREGDIVVSTRSKSGTTWVQAICAFLVFGTPDLPRPLREISPWLDWLVEPHREILDRLAAQPHRRIIKTHTPLDGIPIDERATYIVVGRHPLDMAVSLYYQGHNLDRRVMEERSGQRFDADTRTRRPLDEWLRAWIEWEGDPRESLDSLFGVSLHLGDAWAHRVESNIVLVHYADLLADLEVQMRRLARLLDLEVDEPTWALLVAAARFDQMRARAPDLAPGPPGVLKDTAAFFRSGRSGAGREVLAPAEVQCYETRAVGLFAPDLRAWLHR